MAVARVAADRLRRRVARRPDLRPLHAAAPAAPDLLRSSPTRRSAAAAAEEGRVRRGAQPVLACPPRHSAVGVPVLQRVGQPVPAPPRPRRAPRRALPDPLQRRVRAAAGRRRGRRRPGPPSVVFVVDAATSGPELAALKAEVLRVVQGLPEGVRVALVSFAASVWVHDLGFEGCTRVVVMNGERELESEKVREL